MISRVTRHKQSRDSALEHPQDDSNEAGDKQKYKVFAPGELRSSFSFRGVLPSDKKERLKCSWKIKERMRRIAIRQRMLRKRIRDILIYAVFLVVFTLADVIPYQDEDRFWLVNNLRGQFQDVEFGEEFSPTWGKSMKDVATVEELYQWMQSTFHRTVYEGTFDGKGGVDTRGFILGYGKIVGGIRIGQFRVKPADTCALAFPPFIGEQVEQTCYEKFSRQTESRLSFGDFGNASTTLFEWTGWNGTNAQLERDRPSSGQSTPTVLPDRYFPAPAYSIVLPNRDGPRARAQIQQLIQAKYVDKQTRAVFVDVNVYNAMLGVIVQCRMMFVLTQSGGVVPAWVSSIASTAPLPFMAGHVMYETVGQLLVFLFYVYFVVVEIRLISRIGLATYLKWPEDGRWIHIANIIFYFMLWAFRVAAYMAMPMDVEGHGDGDSYVMLQSYMRLMTWADQVKSFNSCLCYIKLVFYLSISHVFAKVTKTLSYSAESVFGFMIVEAITLGGFAVMFMITFGSKVYNYRTLSNSMFTLVKALLGDSNLDELREADWAVGPTFYFLYVGIQVFVVLNMIIAIISDAYIKAERQLKRSPDVPLWPAISRFLAAKTYKLPCGIGRKLKQYFVFNLQEKQRLKRQLKILRRRSKVYAGVQHTPVGRKCLDELRIRRVSTLQIQAEEHEDALDSAPVLYPQDTQHMAQSVNKKLDILSGLEAQMAQHSNALGVIMRTLQDMQQRQGAVAPELAAACETLVLGTGDVVEEKNNRRSLLLHHDDSSVVSLDGGVVPVDRIESLFDEN
jgi:hypothetical protein